MQKCTHKFRIGSLVLATIHLPGIIHRSRFGKGEADPVSSFFTAGTSDIPVAEEAAITSELMGNQVERIYDVGVSGLHRLLDHLAQLQKATVIVVAAGMEGALPSVVGGLVSAPIIALPHKCGLRG